MRSYLRLGDWNAICDVCGFKFKASQMKKRWDGLMVCETDWESRNPLDFMRVYPDHSNVPWARPDIPDSTSPTYPGNVVIDPIPEDTLFPGGGDGGFLTPADNSISTPSITFPSASDHENIVTGNTASSSAFSATGGRTHQASRWMIFYVGTVEEDRSDLEPILLFDSEVDTVNKTSLPFTDMDFQHGGVYRICVRYQASDDAWSLWSELQEFTTSDLCIPDGLILWYDASATGTITLAGSNVVSILDKSGNNNTATAISVPRRPVYDTVQWSEGSLRFAGDLGLSLAAPLTDTAGELSMFMVVKWTDDPGHTLIGFLGGDNINAVPADFLAAYSSVVQPGGNIQAFAVPGNISLDTAGVPDTGKNILEFILDTAGNTSKIRINGVTVVSGSKNWTGLSLTQICGQVSTYFGNNNCLAEAMAFDTALADNQAEVVREYLADKWGITV